MRRFKINFNQRLLITVVVVTAVLTYVILRYKTTIEDFQTQKIKYNKQDFTVASINPVESAQTIDTILKRINRLIDQNTNKIHDINTLMFVAIHELAHNVNPSVGHDQQFWNTMAMILKIADQNHLYTIVDYSKNPTQYCGMTIDNTPV